MTTVLEADQETVFSYLADIENLPKWATDFARELKRDGEDYKVVNGLGEFFFAIQADADTGVVGRCSPGPEKDQMAIFPTRVVALPGGRTAYSFTMFQGPGMDDELFESQHASLQREFANIEGGLPLVMCRGLIPCAISRGAAPHMSGAINARSARYCDGMGLLWVLFHLSI